MTEINAGTVVMTENECAGEMTQASAAQFELTEQLSRKMHVTLEEARAALEAADWNMLTATHLMEREAFIRKQALNEVAATVTPSEADFTDRAVSEERAPEEAGGKAERREHGLKKVGRALMNLIAIGNRNRFAIHRGGEQLLDMPLTVLAPLLLFSFGTCAFLLVIGLFAGCRYSVNGKDFSAARA